MKTYYILGNGEYYLQSVKPVSFNAYESSAIRFKSLCQALDFNQLHELELSVLKVEITVAYTPDLFTEKELK